MTIVGGKPVTDDSEEEFKSEQSVSTPERKPGDAKAAVQKPHGVADLRSSGDSR